MAKRSNDSSDFEEKLTLATLKGRSLELRMCTSPGVYPLLAEYGALYVECSKYLQLVEGHRALDYPEVHASGFDITSYVKTPILYTEEQWWDVQEKHWERLCMLRDRLRAVDRVLNLWGIPGFEIVGAESKLRRLDSYRIDTTFFVENLERRTRSFKCEVEKVRVIKVKLDLILCCLKQKEQGYS